MASLNVFAFTGNLGADPELRATTSGQQVCNLRVAIQRVGDRPPVWVDVSVWGKAAETCARYLAKGRAVAINGRVDEVRAYMRNTGEPGAALSVSTNEVSFIGPREDGPMPAQGTQVAAWPQAGPVPQQGAAQPVGAGPVTSDDDVPF